MQPVDHWGERCGLCAIVGFAPLAAMAHQLCPLEYGEVLGDGGLRDTGKPSQCVDGLFALPGKLLEDGPAGGVSECAKGVIGDGLSHNETITVWLWFVKRDALTNARIDYLGKNSYADRAYQFIEQFARR